MSLLDRARASLSNESIDPHARPVLVVEDDAGLRAFLVSVLERQGFRVVAAGSGEEAFDLLAGERAQLAVLDIGLPGMDGFAVAEQLEGVPVIIVTGDPVAAYARAHENVPRYRVLPKPIASELLEHAVEEILPT
jgi:two-component system, cell cycle sensor histidine kinase and response regulator CckA